MMTKSIVSWKGLFLCVALALLTLASHATVRAEDGGLYAIVCENALVYDRPNDDARMIGRLAPDAQTIMTIVQDLPMISGDDYKYVTFPYPGYENLHGYVHSSALRFISPEEGDAEQNKIKNMSKTDLAKLPIFSDPVRMYRMPAPVYDVWLISYHKNQRYNVYTKPDVSAERGQGNYAYSSWYIDSRTGERKRAYVSANESVTLLGRDGEWVLIEYRAGKNNVGYRRGYIWGDREGIAVSMEDRVLVAEIPYAGIDAQVTKKTDLVDDTSLRNPYHTIRTLEKNANVTVLGFDNSFGTDWAHVETRSDELDKELNRTYETRGYVRLDCLRLLEP